MVLLRLRVSHLVYNDLHNSKKTHKNCNCCSGYTYRTITSSRQNHLRGGGGSRGFPSFLNLALPTPVSLATNLYVKVMLRMLMSSFFSFSSNCSSISTS